MPSPMESPESSPVTSDKALEKSIISIDPASMADCSGTEANVHWDVRSAYPDIFAVELWVGPDSSPTLFAAGGAFGDAKTGPWVIPGEIVRLRDKSTGDELGRVVMPGPSCN